ncbi:hypothetical protein EVAR_63334_1 [Eumeta japonica]|uniref:Uncharacterized protein n=1 Tax=Eumeta variegata TaxID=151549 RepID=A0A4C1YZR8_EUMVA|nr:hypothetical protein EVAR_63334_1 [Eumeta japonica]
MNSTLQISACPKSSKHAVRAGRGLRDGGLPPNYRLCTRRGRDGGRRNQSAGIKGADGLSLMSTRRRAAHACKKAVLETENQYSTWAQPAPRRRPPRRGSSGAGRTPGHALAQADGVGTRPIVLYAIFCYVRTIKRCSRVGCVRSLSLFYSERIGRWSGREIARSVLSLARSAQAERDNESCFFKAVIPCVKRLATMTERGFVKAQSDNLPKIDAFMTTTYFANNHAFASAELRGWGPDTGSEDRHVFVRLTLRDENNSRTNSVKSHNYDKTYQIYGNSRSSIGAARVAPERRRYRRGSRGEGGGGNDKRGGEGRRVIGGSEVATRAPLA